jgi:hypothetical protein
MIRPFTCVAALLAFGSGLYLYQTKHQAQVLDKQIEHTIKIITATRMQTRELAAAWTLLGNPDRLQQLSDQFLDIKPVLPSQFVAMADLDSRLPPPRPLPAPQPTPTSATPEDDGSTTLPLATTEPAAAPDTPTTSFASAPRPGTAAPVSASSGSPAARVMAMTNSSTPSPAAAADSVRIQAARPPDRKPSETPRPARDVAQGRAMAPARVPPANPAPARPASPSPVIAELDRPTPPAPQHMSAPPAMTGSLLGMAHASTRPPAPLPVALVPQSANGN